MKKRALAIVLCVAMMFSVMPVANAAINTDYKMALVGTVEDFYDSVAGITFDMQILGPAVGSTASIIIKVDATKLEFVTPVANTPNAVNIISTVGLSTLGHPAGWGNLYQEKADWVNSVTFMGGKTADGKTTYLAIQPEFAAANLPTHAAGLTSAAKFRLAFKSGVTEADLDMSTVQVCSIADIDNLHQSEAAVVTDGASVECNYNPSTASGKEQTLEKPAISYPGSDVMNLNGVKVDAANKFVNVPVSLPTAEADVTVQASAKGYYTSTCDDGTEIETGVTYKYSVAMKDGTELPETVSIDETTGLMTIKAGAPEAVVVITATGSYTNNKGNLSTASGTYDVSLRHGDAEEEKDKDPDPDDPAKPIGGKPDVTKALSGVAIYEGTTQITTSAASTTAEKPVAIPASGSNDVTFTASEVDQFGDELEGTATGHWNSFAGAAGVTFDDTTGKVSVASGAVNGTYPVSYTAGTYTATVNVIVDSVAITWPTLANDTITYGQAVSELEINHDGKVEDENGPVADFAFAWTNGTAVLNAGEDQEVEMTCTYGAETKTKNYTVTVDKADQVIAIAQDDDTPAMSVDVETGRTLELKTKVTNKAVPTIETAMTVTYTMADESVATVDTDGVITSVGAVGSDTTLTIKAAGDGNYNEVTRSINVYVTEQKLRAEISFDTTAPVYGQEITATITEASDQPGSITDELDYSWGYWDAENEKFTAKETGTGIGGELPNLAAGEKSTEVKYTPDADDVGKVLALKVNTPTSSTTYHYIHNVTAAMEAPVAKAAQNAPTAATVEAGRSTITVTSVTLDNKVIDFTAPATMAAEDGDNLVFALVAKDATPAADDYSANKVFTKTADGTSLVLNTEYDLYVMNAESTTHDASAAHKQTVSTDTIHIGPDEDDTDDDVHIVEPKAKITLKGAAKFGSELEATTTPAKFTIGDDPTVITVNYNTFVWERTTVPTDGSEPVTTVITGEDGQPVSGNTYTLAEADIGCEITVKASPAAGGMYSGTLTATTAAVEKADAEFDNELGIDKASKADATDGAITGLTDGIEYQYAVKPADPEGEEEPAEPTWTDITVGADGKITGLGVNTYLVRTKETDTHKASEPQEITVTSLGYNITGVVVSYNAKNAVTYELYAWDGDAGDYSTEAAYTGTAVEAAETTTATRQTQNFLIEAIADGTYKLVIKKAAHVSYTIKNVVVDGADVDMTQDSRTAAHSLDMAAGDLNGDGTITVADKNFVTNTANYGKTVETAQNAITDINGDGSVTVADKNIVTNATTYGTSQANYTIE